MILVDLVLVMVRCYLLKFPSLIRVRSPLETMSLPLETIGLPLLVMEFPLVMSVDKKEAIVSGSEGTGGNSGMDKISGNKVSSDIAGINSKD